MNRRARLLGAAACVVWAGCGTDPLAPDTTLELSIVTPRDGELVSHLTPIRLEADGRDPTRGPLPDSAFSWFSHRDGALGVGRVLPEVLLSPGAHLLTVVAAVQGVLPESASVAVGIDSAGVGSLLWTRSIPGEVSVEQMAMAPNGDIVIVFESFDAGVAAVDQAGTVRWVRYLGLVIQSAPAVGPDGTIYLGVWGDINGLLALNPDGSERWRFETRPNSPLITSRYWHIHGAPAVMPDGSLRVVSEEGDGPMYALNADGSVAWRLPLLGGRLFIGSVVVAPDGTAYAMNPNDSLYAVSSDGQRKWAVKLTQIVYWEMPAIDGNGNLYAADGYRLERISPAGAVTGSLAVPTACRERGSPAIAADGRILVGRSDGRVVAVAADMTQAELWTPQGAVAYDETEPAVLCVGSPAIAQGAVYTVSPDTLWAYNPDGTLRFATEVLGAHQRGDSPLIGADGTVYVPTSRGIAAVYDTLGVDPQSPWPMYQGGNGRLGRRQ